MDRGTTMSDERMREAAELVDRIHSFKETIRDHESSIAVLKGEVERNMDRLRLLVEGTGLTEVAGSLARATFGLKSVPHVSDWQALYGYIVANGAWELLHKRVGVRAWEERINMGLSVDGIEQVVVPNVTIKGKP
jgi:hypothetical protein